MIDSELNNRLNFIGSGVLTQDAKAIIEFGDDVSGICDRYITKAIDSKEPRK